MKAIFFKEWNRTLIGMTINETVIEDLPVYLDGEIIMSCWKMNFKERMKALFHGRIWLQVMSGDTHPPITMFCDKDGFKDKKK